MSERGRGLYLAELLIRGLTFSLGFVVYGVITDYSRRKVSPGLTISLSFRHFVKVKYVNRIKSSKLDFVTGNIMHVKLFLTKLEKLVDLVLNLLFFLFFFNFHC